MQKNDGGKDVDFIGLMEQIRDSDASDVDKVAQAFDHITRSIFEHAQHEIELARAMISDQVDLRRNSFANALFEFTNLMLDGNRAEEGFGFLVSVRPDVENYDVLPADGHGLLMQWAGIALLSGFETFENTRTAWNKLVAKYQGMVPTYAPY